MGCSVLPGPEQGEAIELAYASFYLQVLEMRESMRAQTSAEMAGHGGDEAPTSPARPGSGSGPDRSAGRWAPGREQSAEEFLCRFGDAIDDRVAEILDERDALCPRPRPRASFAVVALLPAMTATILLRH